MSRRSPQAKPPSTLTQRRPGTVLRRPATELRLTDTEREQLEDPEWVTEDEADRIVAARRQGEPAIPLEEVLAELGLDD